MTRRTRRPERSHRWTAVSASFVLHATLLVGAAALPAAVLAATRAAPAPDVPARLSWAPRADVPDAVVVTAPVAEAPYVPAPSAELEVADAEVVPPVPERSADEPVAADPCAAPPVPSYREARRLHDTVSQRPGRGVSDAAPGVNAGLGGAIGVGGAGGPGGSAGNGSGGGMGDSAALGVGGGDGSAGSGSGWTGRVAGGGATRGPSIVGELSAPGYPAKARARGWEGRVVLLLTIDARGRVVAAEVLESSGRASLDDAARDAAPDWTFAPALRDGEPVAGTLRVPVCFALTD